MALESISDCLVLVWTEYLYTSLTVNIFFLAQIIWITFGYLGTALYIAYNLHENNEPEVLSLLCWIKYCIICDRPSCNNYHFLLVSGCVVITGMLWQTPLKRSFFKVGHIFLKKHFSLAPLWSAPCHTNTCRPPLNISWFLFPHFTIHMSVY